MAKGVALLNRKQIERLPERARDVVECRKSGLSLNHIRDRQREHPCHDRAFDRPDRPDLTVILETDPAVISERLSERGPHNCFQLSLGSSRAEVHFYWHATDRLIQIAFDVLRVDCNQRPPEHAAALIRDRLLAFSA